MERYSRTQQEVAEGYGKEQSGRLVLRLMQISLACRGLVGARHGWNSIFGWRMRCIRGSGLDPEYRIGHVPSL